MSFFKHHIFISLISSLLLIAQAGVVIDVMYCCGDIAKSCPPSHMSQNHSCEHKNEADKQAVSHHSMKTTTKACCEMDMEMGKAEQHKDQCCTHKVTWKRTVTESLITSSVITQLRLQENAEYDFGLDITHQLNRLYDAQNFVFNRFYKQSSSPPIPNILEDIPVFIQSFLN